MLDFGHTLFGLPFAYLGAFLAQNGTVTLHQFIWITVAMIGARTAALSLNRIIDMPYDGANPRTVGWVMPSGRLRPGRVWIGVFFFGIVVPGRCSIKPALFETVSTGGGGVVGLFIY